MAPKPLRGPTRKSAIELPETARVNFLLEAAKLTADTLPQVSCHLGQTALQVSARDLPGRISFNTFVACLSHAPFAAVCSTLTEPRRPWAGVRRSRFAAPVGPASRPPASEHMYHLMSDASSPRQVVPYT